MKNLIYLIVFLFISPGCKAQSKLVPGKFIIDGKTIIVVKHTYGEKSRFSAYSEGKHEKTGLSSSTNLHPFPVLREDIHVNSDKAKEIILNVLSKRKSALARNKESVDLSITFSQNGDIEDIRYSFNGNPIVTPNEIAKIDTLLRVNIKAIFTGRDYLDYYFIDYNGIKVVF